MLSIGQEVKVLEPESLNNKMIEMLKATLRLYTLPVIIKKTLGIFLKKTVNLVQMGKAAVIHAHEFLFQQN